MHLFLITSVVYTNTQTVFNSQERLNQLIESIKSVRDRVKNVYIVVIEGSFITNKDRELIQKYADFIFYFDVINLEKSMGEIYLIKSYLNYLVYNNNNHIKLDSIETISKLSGRYLLTDDFVFYKYDNDKSIVHTRTKVYQTTYYRFNAKYIHYFLSKLEDVLKTISYEDIEHSFFSNQVFPIDTIQSTQNLGIYGYISPTGEKVYN